MATKKSIRPFCTAHSKQKGTPCGARAVLGGTVCRHHGGNAPQVKRKGLQRVKEMLHDLIDPNRMLRQAAYLAQSDIRQLFDANGNLLPMQDWPEAIAAAVASLEVSDVNGTRTVRPKLWPKTNALELMFKHHGLLAPEKLEIKNLDDISKLSDDELKARVAALKARLDGER